MKTECRRGGGNNLRRMGCLKERTEEREKGSSEKQEEREELLRNRGISEERKGVR
jgi:hypothetical protein